jgi:hypothetical protein
MVGCERWVALDVPIILKTGFCGFGAALAALDAAFEAAGLVGEALGAVLVTPSLLSAMLWLWEGVEKKFRCEASERWEGDQNLRPEA